MVELAQYPFRPKSFRLASGHTLSYLDEGRGPVLVMVHGNPSWSYLYRNVVTELKANYRCIVPDHLGCGFSEKPQKYPYRLASHRENLTALLDHLQVERCILMVHDWGGAIGLGWAGRFPERVQGLVVLNTAAFHSTRIPFRIAVCRLPFLGSLLVRGCNGFAWPATFMAVCKRMNKEVAEGFLHPYDSWQNRVAVNSFVKDIPLHVTHPSWETLSQVEESLKQLQHKPMLICWGGKDFCFNLHFYRQWQQRFPRARCRYYCNAGHYVLEDAFEEIMAELVPFLEKCNG
jgi:haloalkane dehalogenase